MKTYSKFQFGWLITFIFIPVLILSSLAYVYQWGNHPMDLGSYILLLVILGGCILLFFGMNVSVDESYIKIYYGIGILSKKIKIDTIETVKIVRNPWYYGLGIHFIPHGMLYNISGRNAVELNFRNSNKIIRIGTLHPGDLKNAIQANLIHKK